MNATSPILFAASEPVPWQSVTTLVIVFATLVIFLDRGRRLWRSMKSGSACSGGSCGCSIKPKKGPTRSSKRR